MHTYHKGFVAAGALVLGVVLTTTAPGAGASGTQTYCPTGRLCLWFNSGNSGARADLRVSDANLSNELFNDGLVNANGWLVQVSNNSASFHNRTGYNVTFFNDTGCSYGGGYREIGPGDKGDFGAALKNMVSSIGISDGTICTNVDQSNA